MATYYDIHGQKVKYLSSDPSPVTKGQVWYNSTSNTLKISSYKNAVWTSGTNSPYAARGSRGFGDSKNSAQIFGGYTTTAVSTSVEYDGSSWSATPSLNTATYASSVGVGVKSSAITVGGAGQNSEQWNGSAWSNITTFPNSPNSVENTGGFGTTTAGYFLGGSSPSPTTATVKPSTITWNGSSWTALNPMSIGRTDMGSCGTATAAIVFGGESGVPPSYPGVRNNQESWDGTCWSASPATLNSPRTYIMSFGITTASMAAGGTPPQTANAETWNGTSWAEGNNLNSARHSGGGSGITTAGLVFSGGVWNQPSLHKLTESYDGSCWTEVADLNNDHMTNINSLGLTQTAAICSSGYKFPSPAATAFTEEWDGSSWTEIADLNTARYYAGGSGSVTSGLIMGGEVPAPTYYAKVEHFNGTAWTEIADMGTARTHFPGTTTNGPATGVVISGGGPGFQTSSETYSAGEAIKTFTAS